jgi:hypothetical protein
MAGLTNKELLEKAFGDTGVTSDDFGGAGEAPLNVEQVREFIRLMQAEQVMLPDVETKTSNAPKWQESILDFSTRMLKPGVQGTRLAESARTKPSTGIVELNSVLVRGEVPVADEVMEDAAAQDFETSLAALIADRAGFDVEDMFVNGDTSLNDGTILDLLDGWLKQTDDNGQSFSAASLAQDYQSIFQAALVAMPIRFKRGLTVDGRFYVPVILEEKYRDQLASRGTALGDATLEGTRELKYQGVTIKGVPTFAITAGSPDTSAVLLTNRHNLYAGYQRRITIETWRDPREGARSWVVTARVACAVAIPEAAVIATATNVEP